MAKGYSTTEFRRRLTRVPVEIRKQTNAAIRKNAEEWVRASKAAAPKDPEDGTPLTDSIRHYETETGGQVVRAGGETTTKTTTAGSYDYARAQEFGTQAMAANPFFWPVYRLLKKRFANRRARALNKAVRDLNGK